MAYGRVPDGLMKWLHREEWEGLFLETFEKHLTPACDAWDVEIDDLATFVGADGFMMLWGCAFEDFLTRETEDGANIVDDYLKRRGWKEKAPTKAYLKALRNSTMSLYELSDIRPGESLLARDLVRGGEPVRVFERSGTQMLKPWDCIAARIVDVGQKKLFGGGLLPFERTLSEELLDLLHRACETAERKVAGDLFEGLEETAYELLSGPEMLRHAAPIFTAFWLDGALRRVIAPEMPEHVNGDGEALAFFTTRYGLAPRVKSAAVRAVLDTIRELEPTDKGHWVWIEERAPRGTAAPDKGRRLIVTSPDEDFVVMGYIRLRHRMLTLETNSRERADAGRHLVETALSGLVTGPLSIEEKTLDQIRAEAPLDGEGDGEPAASGLDPKEERALLHDYLDHHYLTTLEEPLPFFDGQTPLQAVRTPEGRQQAAEWLKSIENHLAHRPESDALAGYDIGWLWERLGIADLRR